MLFSFSFSFRFAYLVSSLVAFLALWAQACGLVTLLPGRFSCSSACLYVYILIHIKPNVNTFSYQFYGNIDKLEKLVYNWLNKKLSVSELVRQAKGEVHMQEKNTYTIQELFDDLPITIAELARQSVINEVTLARIRDGKGTRRSTVNKLLLTLSKIYERPLSVHNVTGINVQTVNKGSEARQAKRESDLAIA